MKKIVVCLLCITFLFITEASCALSDREDIICNILFNQNTFDHDYFLEYVFFGRKFTRSEDESYWDPSKDMNSLNIIEYASYLCVDQFNNGDIKKHEQDQEKLDRLRKYVSGLPGKVEDINPTEDDRPRMLTGTTHRSFTHRGWVFPYHLPGNGGDIAKGRTRERILLRAVDHVFDFYTSGDGLIESGVARISGKPLNDIRCTSYAKLIYYIHLVGDCYEDLDFKQANGNNNGQKIPLGRDHPGRTIETSDLISEIINVCKELFYYSKSNQERYSILKAQLNKEKQLISDLYRQTGEIDSDEDYKLYHERVCSLMGILINNLPKLLRNETDFADAFSDFLLRE